MTAEKLNLHEIDSFMSDLIERAINKETGELDPNLAGQIEELEMDRADKILNCARYMNENMAMVLAYSQQAVRLLAHAKKHQAKVDFLKSWVESACNKDETFFAPDIGKVSFKPSEKIVAHDIDAVPAELVNIPETPATTLDKAKAKAWAKLHHGEAPAGCTITQHKSMQIR